ncbi:hypothetical protein [Rhodococcus sp. ACT016]|uniref:hypothetical protein n=1 Tax=Rhodococcus sp. ACT016 TaxID=3134808 RepID=UPI003D2716E3
MLMVFRNLIPQREPAHHHAVSCLSQFEADGVRDTGGREPLLWTSKAAGAAWRGMLVDHIATGETERTDAAARLMIEMATRPTET